VIDLRSDTVTVPTPAMRGVIADALVGDEAYGEDPSVTALENDCCSRFDKEAALFTCSATMSNQIAVRAMTLPGDEVILDRNHHIAFFESSQTAMHAGVILNNCETHDGIITAPNILSAIAVKPRGAYYAQARLVCIENSISYYGGRVYPIDALAELAAVCSDSKLSLYMDGARLMNSCVASGTSPKQYARHVDALNVCCAKGLGAPFGSVLLGSAEFIAKARALRKYLGGAMHQAGFMAAAAHYAIRNNVTRLRSDHENAKALGAALLLECPRFLRINSIETNIVHIDVSNLNVTAAEFTDAARKRNVLLTPWTNRTVRAVTHLGIESAQIPEAIDGIVATVDEFSVAK
jgi:threonine aldolase